MVAKGVGAFVAIILLWGGFTLFNSVKGMGTAVVSEAKVVAPEKAEAAKDKVASIKIKSSTGKLLKTIDGY